jgi:hypothetical protein
MKYLQALKNKYTLNGESKKAENIHQEELHKPQKVLYGVFGVQEGSTSEKNIIAQNTKALGYGCAGCGNRVYQAVEAWVLSELPESSPWQYEHKPVVHWQCEQCSAVYELIGGSRGPQPLN